MPLPVYRIAKGTTSELAHVSRARMVGWRYPIVGGEYPALAFLAARRKQLIYVGISEGAFAERFLNAALVADRKLSSAPLRFEPRFLDIPALHLYLLWFRSTDGNDCFIPLASNRSRVPLVLTHDLKGLVHKAKASIRATKHQIYREKHSSVAKREKGS